MVEEKAEETEKPKRRSGLLVGGAFAAVLVLFIIPYWYTANPKSCIRCHEMKPFYTTWKESMHSVAAKDCFYCHLKPGLFNRMLYQVTFYREV